MSLTLFTFFVIERINENIISVKIMQEVPYDPLYGSVTLSMFAEKSHDNAYMLVIALDSSGSARPNKRAGGDMMDSSVITVVISLIGIKMIFK